MQKLCNTKYRVLEHCTITYLSLGPDKWVPLLYQAWRKKSKVYKKFGTQETKIQGIQWMHSLKTVLLINKLPYINSGCANISSESFRIQNQIIVNSIRRFDIWKKEKDGLWQHLAERLSTNHLEGRNCLAHHHASSKSWTPLCFLHCDWLKKSTNFKGTKGKGNFYPAKMIILLVILNTH
jgi:hypothetical protein